jgi:uncharacterized protein YuzE
VLHFKLDSVADAAYVQVSEKPVQYARALGEQRILDYDAHDEIVGIEFLDVSHGVSLRDLPYQDELAPLRRVPHPAVRLSGLRRTSTPAATS